MRPTPVAWTLAAALAAGCHAAAPAPVRLTGDPTSLQRLAGEWSGSYQSAATGRSGSIVFTLTAADTSARGDVVMVPRGGDQPLRPAGPGQFTPDSAATPQVLVIRFVQAAGDSVSGLLAPYTDPECGCTVTTTFTGRLEGDRIRGTFVSLHALHGSEYTGTWEVHRRR